MTTAGKLRALLATIPDEAEVTVSPSGTVSWTLPACPAEPPDEPTPLPLDLLRCALSAPLRPGMWRRMDQPVVWNGEPLIPLPAHRFGWTRIKPTEKAP